MRGCKSPRGHAPSQVEWAALLSVPKPLFLCVLLPVLPLSSLSRGFEYFQDFQLSGQPVPLFDHPYSQFLSYVSERLSACQSVPIPPVYSRRATKKSPTPASLRPPIHRADPLEPFLQAKQLHHPQPFLTEEMLQPFRHFHGPLPASPQYAQDSCTGDRCPGHSFGSDQCSAEGNKHLPQARQRGIYCTRSCV